MRNWKDIRLENILYTISIVIMIFLFFGIAFCLLGCTPITPYETDTETTIQDAGIDGGMVISCANTQQKLEQMKCNELLEIPGDDQIIGTEDDPAWEIWCKWVQESGIDTLNLQCISNSGNCKEAEKCLEQK